MNECWHVILTTFSIKNAGHHTETMSIPSDKRISIITKEISMVSREVQVNMGPDAIYLYLVSSRIRVKVNNYIITVANNQSYQHLVDGEVQFVIYKPMKYSIRVSSLKYEVSMDFDGRNVIVHVIKLYFS